MYSPVEPLNVDENPKYRTFCCGHVTSATQFICILNIVGLCFSSVGSFPFGLIITIPLIYAFYIPFKGIKELNSGKLVPMLILSGINIVFLIIGAIVCVGLMLERGHKIFKKDNVPFILIIFLIIGLQIIWGIWCFMVILRCYEYLKNAKIAQRKQAQFV